MRPVCALRKTDLAFARHLKKEQVRELLYVVAVPNPIVAQRVAEPPEFGNNVGCHAATNSRLRSAMSAVSLPSKIRSACPHPPRFDRTGTDSKSDLSMERFATKCLRM